MNNRIVAAIGFIIIIAILSLLYTSNILGFDIVSFMGFIAFLGAIVYADKKKVKTEGIVFIRRTKRGRNFIDNTSKKNTRVWKKLAILGVVVAIPLMIIGSWFLIGNALDIIIGAKEGGVKLLLPGPVSSPVSTTGIFVVPWWIWVIGVAIVIIPHEFFHGIMCRLDNIKIKSVGWLLLVIIPGAFVEPDEAQLKKAKRSTKLKVYAAGSFANMLTAFVAVLIMIVMFSTLLTPAGVHVNNGNLSFIVTEINNVPIHNEADFRYMINNSTLNHTMELSVVTSWVYPIPMFDGKTSFIAPSPAYLINSDSLKYNSTLKTDPDELVITQAMLPIFGYGINVLYAQISLILLWIFLFCLGVGMVNMLPIKPLDGGLVFEELCGKFTKRTKYIVKAVTIIMLIVLIFNLVGPVFI